LTISSQWSRAIWNAAVRRVPDRLKPLLRRLVDSRFLRSVSIVAGGTAAAQLINVAVSPLITRLYGPEAFGIVAVFMASLAIVGPLSTLSYAQAMALPPSDAEARALLGLSLRIGVVVAVLALLVVLGFHAAVADLIGFTAASTLLLLAPLMILLSAINQPLVQWLVRKKAFTAISRIRIIEAATMGTSKTATGLVIATAPILLLLNVLGQLLHTCLLWRAARPTLADRSSGPLPALGEVARRYRDFPLYRTPQGWITGVSFAMPSLMLAALFGPAAAGFYAIARTVLGLPISLISGAVGTVFLPHIAEAAHRGERLRPLVVKATAGLAVAGLLPFGTIVIFGPGLFGLVFGPDWAMAGEYARWLALWLYLSFMNVPSVQVMPILGLQAPVLAFQIVTELLRVGALAVGAFMIGSAVAALALFSLVGVVANMYLIVWAISSCGTRLRKGIRHAISA
jgi:O-antigen/teichoic acid export membrane protein